MFCQGRAMKRMAIVVAGPVANLLLAVLLFAGTFVIGVPGQRAVLAEPPAETAAAIAGIHDGDVVVAVDGEPVGSWQDLRWRLLKGSGRAEATLEVERPSASGQRERLARNISLSALTSADWESNFMPTLGLKVDFGPPLIDQVVAGKPAERAGLRVNDRLLALLSGEQPLRVADLKRRFEAWLPAFMVGSH